MADRKQKAEEQRILMEKMARDNPSKHTALRLVSGLLVCASVLLIVMLIVGTTTGVLFIIFTAVCGLGLTLSVLTPKS